MRKSRFSDEQIITILKEASRDPALGGALWIVVNLPLAARVPGFEAALARLDRHPDGPLSLFSPTGAIADTLDGHALATGGRNDLGETAGQALLETVSARLEPALFGPESAQSGRRWASSQGVTASPPSRGSSSRA